MVELSEIELCLYTAFCAYVGMVICKLSPVIAKRLNDWTKQNK